MLLRLSRSWCKTKKQHSTCWCIMRALLLVLLGCLLRRLVSADTSGCANVSLLCGLNVLAPVLCDLAAALCCSAGVGQQVSISAVPDTIHAPYDR
jgi:hypothetical protein